MTVAARLAVLRKAAKEHLDSLGEYVRQSMYENPEWRSGIKALTEALKDLESPMERMKIKQVKTAVTPNTRKLFQLELQEERSKAGAEFDVADAMAAFDRIFPLVVRANTPRRRTRG